MNSHEFLCLVQLALVVLLICGAAVLAFQPKWFTSSREGFARFVRNRRRLNFLCHAAGYSIGAIIWLYDLVSIWLPQEHFNRAAWAYAVRIAESVLIIWFIAKVVPRIVRMMNDISLRSNPVNREVVLELERLYRL